MDDCADEGSEGPVVPLFLFLREIKAVPDADGDSLRIPVRAPASNGHEHSRSGKFRRRRMSLPWNIGATSWSCASNRGWSYPLPVPWSNRMCCAANSVGLDTTGWYRVDVLSISVVIAN